MKQIVLGMESEEYDKLDKLMGHNYSPFWPWLRIGQKANLSQSLPVMKPFKLNSGAFSLQQKVFLIHKVYS